MPNQTYTVITQLFQIRKISAFNVDFGFFLIRGYCVVPDRKHVIRLEANYYPELVVVISLFG